MDEAQPPMRFDRLPGRRWAFVEDDKLGYYLGTSATPSPRAGVFRGVLGFTEPDELRRAILDHACSWPAEVHAVRSHGVIYNVIGPMVGPSGRRIERMITAWIIEPGSASPRNVTAFPDRRRRV